MTRLKYTFEKLLCLVKLYFKYKSSRNQSQKFILATVSCSLKHELPIFVLYGYSLNNIVVIRANITETLVSCASRLKWFLGEVSDRA